MESFTAVKNYVLRDIEALLKRDQIDEEYLLWVVTINLFSIHNSAVRNPGKKLSMKINDCVLIPFSNLEMTQAEIMQRTAVKEYATRLHIELMGSILARAVRCCQGNFKSIRKYMPAISIFCEWLQCHYEAMRPDPRQDKRPWTALWKHLASLLSHLITTDYCGEGNSI